MSPLKLDVPVVSGVDASSFAFLAANLRYARHVVSGDHRLAVVTVETGARFEASAPRPLFELRRLQPNPQWSTPYAVTADKQRFLIGAVVDEGGDSPISVVLNWTRLLPQ